MENKKIAATALIIAIALSAVGLIYAHWSDTATISGQIHMGTLTLAYGTWEDPTAQEEYLNPTPPPIWKLGEPEGKDVAVCSAEYLDPITDPHTGIQGFKTLNLTVENAYPQLGVHITFIAQNIGTVPLYVYGLTLVGEKLDHTGAHIYNLVMNTSLDSSKHIIADIWEDVDNSGNVTAGDINIINLVLINQAFPYQIEPRLWDKMEADMDFKQAAEMCHTYILNFQLLAVQWNKLSEVYP
jgi:hypothetical protein